MTEGAEMDNKTKITLDVLLARKEQAKEDKRKHATRELYVESLDGTITIKAPTRAILSDARNTDDDTLADRYLVYQCVVEPNLKDKKLQAAYDVAEPDEIVDKVFELGEVSKIAAECVDMAGFGNSVESVKN